jgi:CBS domain containing-hemolysin-like protein
VDSVLGVSLVVLALVLLNGLYVAAEFALVGVPRGSIHALAEAGHRNAIYMRGILEVPRRQDRYIATTQLGVTLASLGLGMYGEKGLAALLEPLFVDLGTGGTITRHVIASSGAIALVTFLHVVLGEMVPKSIALARPVAMVNITAPIQRVTQVVLFPLVTGLEWVSHKLLRGIGIDRGLEHDGTHHTPEDLAHIVELSRAAGGLRSESGKALAEMFDFSTLKADDVMVPRVAMYTLELGATPDEIAAVVREAQHTRYPVHEGDVDEIIGMVHIRDLMLLLRKWRPLAQELVRPISFVPETMALERVLAVMRRDQVHAVIVMDEQGGTAGMLTVKDLFEEVVGTIDEKALDPVGRQEAYRDAEGRLHVFGTLRIAELEEILALELPAIDAETVSGLVLLRLGRPAKVGDVVVHGSVRFVVIETEGRGVSECLVQPVDLVS